MGKHGKKYKEGAALLDPEKRYSVDEACALVGRTAKKKFNETVDIAIRLGIDPKHADQMVRGAVVLPHGIGKTVRVAVFAKGDKAREATEAGADVVGAEDLAAKVQAQCVHPGAHPGLDGAERKSKLLSEFRMRQATEIRRLDEFALLIGQAVERTPDTPLLFTTRRGGFRIVRDARVLDGFESPRPYGVRP